MHDWIGICNYIRGDVSCAIILFYFLTKAVGNGRRTRENRCFIELVAWMILYILMYTLSGTFKYGYVSPAAWVYNLVVMIIMVSQTMVAYKWFYYSELKQGARWLKKKAWRAMCFAPAALFCVISVLSVFTKWIFFIDSELTYHRGKLFLLQYVLVAAYMGITSVKALMKSMKKEHYVQKYELFTLFTFIVPPAITTALQALIPMGVFLVGYGFTIAIIMVYLNSTQEQVSQDSLTRLNNRAHMSRFLNTRMNAGNDRLYLLILDANSFKSINDIYGHVEGDQALIRIAKALMNVANRYACYVSRYGGDEFIVIQEADSAEQIEELCKAIHEQLDVENEKADAPYRLSVSIGYSQYNDKIKNIPDFIHAADERLLRNKVRYHAKNG